VKINWRNCILTSALSMAAILTPVLFFHSHGRMHSLDVHRLFKLGAACAAIVPAAIGKQLLRHGHHRLATQLIGLVLVILLLPLLTRSVSGTTADVLYFLVVAGAAATLPIAWLLNRKVSLTGVK
jgi:hypothetical protein